MSESAAASGIWPSTEQRLLLQAASLPDADAREAYDRWLATQDLHGEVGQQDFRLLPLLYSRMLAAQHRDPFMARLKGIYRRAWFDAQQRFHLTRPAIEALVGAGIQPMLLKGAALAIGYYRNLAVRPMADIDVAVRRAELPRALEVLAVAGWHPTEPVTADVLRFRHAVQCVGPAGSEIDLHWHVIYEAANEAVDTVMWDTSESLDFLGIPVRQLDPTGALLLIVLHGVRWNAVPPIRWVPDALTILTSRGDTLDWSRVVAFARDHRLCDRLSQGLDYLTTHFAVTMPEVHLSVLRGAGPSLLERLERGVLLRDNRPLEASVLGTQWIYFVEYCRYAESVSPITFLNGLTHYLRYSMRLTGRREVLPLILNGLKRRVSGRTVAAST